MRSLFKPSSIKYVLFVVVVGLLFGVYSYSSEYSSLQKKFLGKNSKLDLKTYNAEGTLPEKDIVSKYSKNTDFPEFVSRMYLPIEDASGVRNGYYEQIGFRAFSVGTFDISSIRNSSGTKILGYALEVGMLLDDNSAYLSNNESFTIALLIASDEDLENRIFAPGLKNLEDFDVADSLNLTIEEIKNIFSENSKWVIYPYTRDGYFDYLLSKADSSEYRYIDLVNDYYGGGDSGFTDKVLSRNISEIKKPLMIMNTYEIIEKNNE